MYALADMFFIEDLKTLSEAKLQARLKLPVESMQFTNCIREIYALTYGVNTLRSAVVKAAVTQRKKPGMIESIKDLIREGGDFAVDYFETLEKQIY